MENNNNQQTKNIISQNNDYFEDYIDLSKIFRSIVRKKIIVIPIAAIGFIGSIIYTKIKAPIWEGQFQIVLDLDSNTTNKYDQLITNQIIANLASKKNSNSLKTEVKILESPSILQPVFNFVVDKKSGLKPNKIYNSNYRSWSKNSLNINLEPGTSVLTIKYKDNDKSLILPVLNKISNEYQKYSSRDKEKSISQGITYLEDQIKKVKIESDIALSNLQEFSLNNLLGNEQGLPLSAPFLNEDRIDNFTYDVQSNARQSLQIEQLRNLESKLIEMSAVLTPESKVIKSLNEKIVAYKESLSRPKEVILEFRNLQRISNLKEKLLVKLEAEIAALKLDQAQQTNPWELISTPTLFNNPIGLSKKIIVLIGTFSAILLASIASLIYERISGKLFEIEDFVKTLQIPILKTLFISKINSWSNSINFISEEILESKQKGDLALIVVSENKNSEEAKIIYEEFNKNFNSSDKKVLLTNNFLEARQYLIKIIICISGNITRNELAIIKQDIDLQKSKIKGLIFIDN